MTLLKLLTKGGEVEPPRYRAVSTQRAGHFVTAADNEDLISLIHLFSFYVHEPFELSIRDSSIRFHITFV